MSPPFDWPAGAATGVGSLPGRDVDEAVRIVLGELPDLPHLPELPERGPGAALIGRTAAGLLADLPVDLQPAGWRLVPRPGVEGRRAHDLLRRDLDALSAAAAGWTGPLKVQVAGPWTMAAGLELPRGGRALGDPGATRDIAGALAEGVAQHLADLARRLPGARLVVQLDEPSLPAVLAGRVPLASGLRTAAPVEPASAEAALAAVLEPVRAADAVPAVHCCAPDAPLGLFVAAGAAAVSVDGTRLGPADDDAVGTAVEAGRVLLLGLLPGTDTDLSDPSRHPSRTVRPARALWRRLGLAPDRLASAVTVTTTCGLAGASPAYARAALGHLREVGRLLVEAPEEEPAG